MYNDNRDLIAENMEFLQLLSKQFPSIQSVCTEIINLEAILDLPKGTEHFISDLHGESEAVAHIMNNASGVIREKIDLLYSETVSDEERSKLATLIYYPQQKLDLLKAEHADDLNEWYHDTLVKLIDICRVVASKYTRSKVRKALPADFAYIIDELLHADHYEKNKEQYYGRIFSSIVDIGRADTFICALSGLIKHLAVDRLHVLGDIYDRGPGAEDIMKLLENHHSVDVVWGNHDLLWMAAAAGNEACIANVLNVSLSYANVDTLENGYGISLRALTTFAEKTYGDSEAFRPKVLETGKIGLNDIELVTKLRKAAAIMQLKLEGQIIARHPEYDMDERMMLDKIDYKKGTVTIQGKVYPLKDKDFPTINPDSPYELTTGERELMDSLKESFIRSDKLQAHAKFLLDKGALYRCCNSNIMFHGCIPLNKDGSFERFEFEGKRFWGKRLFDYCERKVRQGFFAVRGSKEKRDGEDFMWWLWCGKNSPVFGRSRMTTFERMLVEDKATWDEPKNHYYRFVDDPAVVNAMIEEFGMDPSTSHIINGHVPVKSKDGESPIKCDGKLLIIDGGFCKAYQKTTGIAGYTLIYNSYGLRLVSHGQFKGIAEAVAQNTDILSTTKIFEVAAKRRLVADTDIGKDLRNQVSILKLLLEAYRSGAMIQPLK
ncbi:MAG: fructose-1,6-bisphosphatase [Oscillospiraceae bacterium]|nr:fructose-1,6-bisphosphatase [Oscillospiraceae bacterium]